MARSTHKTKLKQFHKALNESYIKTAKGVALSANHRAVTELEQEAERLVALYLGKSPRLRPSTAAREFKAMAKGLRRAANASGKVGKEGLAVMFALSFARRSGEDIDVERHIDYLERLAIYAERAAETYAAESESMQDGKGGRPPDQNLRDLVAILMYRFQDLLAIRPTHTVDKEAGLGGSPFDIFVKEAIAQFAPEGVEIEPRKIDDAIAWVLPSRDFEAFVPPPLPED